ncbi:twin-arginine translocase subunit TatC [Fluoribacter dumoffii]|uniref:Sec-independent protein translocase protein TatC n=1 Tax=Fluoribacter dumoffii TaxID=463 RepID=A0A377G698_9GAMM|nr:twin-arginine translocase subunit TatC [Fluoribacter dumoffii]KTC91554.1 Sec-independent protein translocase TatC [Fluoribacter dumoffii NY 23]MCW8387322.1 twin-arginine translocase subunit TatC [Fluoribacter dumoffii]MCW8417171.1 twin-arginine translocase subunit TatC [Fluoribacter dumoffii]MCW8454989.1 twin-arginine translocase subunit TatC [Fluoribacter dumoffii]MCW8460934.1 twin-arginine translocase subunit TatC [Fluoribacter dumoffii]
MLNHLLELRRRGLQTLIWFVGLFFIFFFWANDLFQALVSPLLHTLSGNEGLIATQVTSPVFTPLKVAADAALLLSAPIALFQFWRFISPGLYAREKTILRFALIFSLLLFSAGVLFCFYLVLPFMFHFFAHALPKGVRYMPDMAYAVDFITKMLLTFGLCFQVPLICFVLVRLQIIEVTTLKTIRPYIIVGAFIVGMLLTPPDVFSQIMLAVPLCLLYETGIIFAIYFI